MKGFSIRQVGIGDGVQFTSLPENYYRVKGKKLVDVSQPWYLDHNPYIERRDILESEVIELWNYPKRYEWPAIRDSVYLSNAEVHASIFGIKNPHLIRPRLYCYENFPFEKRELILFHPFGKSHGAMPEPVIDHVLKKYKPTGRLIQIGLPTDPDLGIPKLNTPGLWDLTKQISEARMLIGVDSGPAWIAACYPDVVVKKVRTKFQGGWCEPEDWVPLDVRNIHSFWDDRAFQIHNVTENDLAFTLSYQKL